MRIKLAKTWDGPWFYLFVGGLWLIYALLTILAPQPNIYHLPGWQRLALQLSVVIPVLGIWQAGAYGVVRFKRYTRIIRLSPDGAALNVITNGLLVLFLSFIAQSLVSVARWYAVGTPALNPTVLLYNHLPLVMALAAVILIYLGSTQLEKLVSTAVPSRQLLVVFLPFMLAAALFAAYFYPHIDHSVINGVPNFILPGKWPFYTMALPYLVVWFLGVLSIVNLANYISNVKGAIYKSALTNLALGIIAVVSLTTLIQLLVLAATALSKLTLGPILGIVYLALILYSVGFLLIANGARKLSRIEDVT